MPGLGPPEYEKAGYWRTFAHSRVRAINQGGQPAGYVHIMEQPLAARGRAGSGMITAIPTLSTSFVDFISTSVLH